MAIEDILRALDEQARADCDEIIGEANAHAKLIIEEAEREAEQIHEGFVHQVERVATAKASKKINAARLEAKMTVSSVKGEGVTSVFEQANDRLASVRGSDYDALFAKLAAEALDGVSGAVTIHVRSEDTERAQQAATQAGLTAEVVGDLDTAGGLIVETNGGKVVRRNTLEDRLDRVVQFVQADVAQVLFS
jgi:vacuolar-type H+-ATPase subunit E/Vma4